MQNHPYIGKVTLAEGFAAGYSCFKENGTTNEGPEYLLCHISCDKDILVWKKK